MNIILGAGGQVGSRVAALLESKGKPVRRVFHHAPQQLTAKAQHSEDVVADYFDEESLKKAFDGADTALLLTPESMTSKDMLADARRVLANYVAALKNSGIRRVVGLSSCGAQQTPGAGTLQLYALLEETLHSLDIETCIVRPAYYYSNWMMYMDTARKDSILPAFFPPDHAIAMIAPQDVAAFIADVLDDGMTRQMAEITGPTAYTASDIARCMGDMLGKDVVAIQIPREEWLPGLLQAGFSQSSAEHLLGMTQAVIDNRTNFTTQPIHTGTTFPNYLSECLFMGQTIDGSIIERGF
ncbi:NAD(P)H-binding protein [Eubacteriales bacterium OttesenSCG-928-K08]|nr:NAD(P)H-binding protein [Eubacteriales bacterium OttesenSCG-928-K08]